MSPLDLMSNSGSGNLFFCCPQCPDGLWGPPNPQWVPRFITGGYSSRRVTLTTHLHLEMRLRKGAPILLLPIHAFTAHSGTILPLPLPLSVAYVVPKDQSPRLYEIFRNTLSCHSEEFSATRPTPKRKEHRLSAVRDYLFNIFAATLHIATPSPPSISRQAPHRSNSCIQHAFVCVLLLVVLCVLLQLSCVYCCTCLVYCCSRLVCIVAVVLCVLL